MSEGINWYVVYIFSVGMLINLVIVSVYKVLTHAPKPNQTVQALLLMILGVSCVLNIISVIKTNEK